MVGYKFCEDGIHVIREEKFCDGSNKDGCRDESDENASFCEDIISQDVLLEGLSVQWRISVSAMNMSVMGSFIAEKI